ncbi:MAG: DUF1778 domain-containing protein [Fluviicoccus sp.]|uniref:type II toxin-antitoxin system TacA family antitoxin n=1 Tax=Fluviicoccus sp. TaxID=2003552 RepID=UPI0027175E14|nr:DUF1778 domain-containing protein [Fluviicoccus sp.]MDO8331750.1 DUF1778 domain-containing protein [Fluviicoccus sp.]
MPSHAVSAERINLRASAEAKQVIEQAAQLIGTNLSAFMLNQSYEAALRIIQQHSVIMLSNADRDAIMHALNNPQEPTRELRELMALAR